MEHKLRTLEPCLVGMMNGALSNGRREEMSTRGKGKEMIEEYLNEIEREDELAEVTEMIELWNRCSACGRKEFVRLFVDFDDGFGIRCRQHMPKCTSFIDLDFGNS